MVYIQVINACFYTGDRIQILSQYVYIHNNTVVFSSEKSFKSVLHARCARRISASIYYSVIAVQKGVDIRL